MFYRCGARHGARFETGRILREPGRPPTRSSTFRRTSAAPPSSSGRCVGPLMSMQDAVEYAVLSKLKRLTSASSITLARFMWKSYICSYIPSLLRIADWGVCLRYQCTVPPSSLAYTARFPTNRTPLISSSEMDGTMRVSSSRALKKSLGCRVSFQTACSWAQKSAMSVWRGMPVDGPASLHMFLNT